MPHRISKLAAEVDVKPDTIRYYERAGLLPPAERGANGYRLYDEDDVERMRFIRGAQRFGLGLEGIRELLAIRDQGACPCGHTQALVRERIAKLDAEVERMRLLRVELARLSEALHTGSSDGTLWPCEQKFIEAGRKQP